MSYYLIQGINPGQVPGIRSEFSVWASNPNNAIQFSLFIRALQAFYNVPYTQTLSYFQVAGIHGWPGNIPWDNSLPPANNDTTDPPSGISVYCTHNMITFPTWHRPYMLLFEQRLWELMRDVIGQLRFSSDNERNIWIAEKDKWRLPYWDWGVPAGNGPNPKFDIPSAFTTDMIKIATPGSSTEMVQNPLARYQLIVNGKLTLMGDPSLGKYRIGDDGPSLPWSQCSGTSRCAPAINQVTSPGDNNWVQTNKNLKSANWYKGGADAPDGQTITDLVARLYSDGYVATWDNFASTVYHSKNQKWQEYLSIEYIHNNLHNFIGGVGGVNGVGIGHMGDVPVSSFDPVFWMHHCNIDRQLAMWQIINPKAWLGPQDKPNGYDPLTPFHHNFGGGSSKRGVDYFNSNDIQSWTQYGYQYDDLVRGPNESDVAYQARIKKHAQEIYGQKSTGSLLTGDKLNLFKGKDRKNFKDYIIDIVYDRQALGGAAYTIHFFLGDVTDEELNATEGGPVFHKGHVGCVYTFSSLWGNGEDGGSGCDNCSKQQEEGVLSKAQVPLTIPLYYGAANEFVPLGGIDDADEVENYLKNNLSWKVVKVPGQIIPIEQLPRTKIYALKGDAQHLSLDHEEHPGKSVYGNYERMPLATQGKPAGAEPEDYEFNSPSS